MLKASDLQMIAKLVKIPAADLEKAIKDEKEVEVKVPENLSVLTTEELETRDNNSKNDGIKIGKEIGIKEVRTKAGLEDTVGKDPEAIAKAISAKAVADAKIEPDKKVAQLNEQIGLLQKAATDKDAEIATLKTKTDQANDDTDILASLPQGRAGNLSDKDYLMLTKAKLGFERVDGKLVAKKDGQIVRDPATKNPAPLGEAIKGLFTEQKWITAEGGAGGAGGGGGRGGGDNNPAGTFTKRSQVVEHYEKQGKSVNGAAGMEIASKIAELKKANPEFDLNA